MPSHRKPCPADPDPDLARRRFLKQCARAGAAAPWVSSPAVLAACARCPSRREPVKTRLAAVILKSGAVYRRGRFERLDMKLADGRITHLAPTIDPRDHPGAAVIDCTDQYISPGWVDLHCHVGTTIGVDSCLVGPEMGVTALVDAGTYGPETFPAFMNTDHRRAPAPLYLFLNVRGNGIAVSNILFKSVPGVEDVAGARQLVEQHADIIKGLKVRLDTTNTGSNNPAYLANVTADLGAELGLPVMYHLGNPDPSITDFLKNAKAGDIITHCLRDRNNAVIGPDGTLRPEVIAAESNGVCFDVGHGFASFQFDSARKALDQGFDDFTISSDLWLLPSLSRARTFANVVSKFLALGLSLETVTGKISTQPRKMLNLEFEIDANRRIDLTVFSILAGSFVYQDTAGEEIVFNQRLIPEYALIGNDVFRAGDRDRELFVS